MKGSRSMRKLTFLFLVLVSPFRAVQAEEKLQLWPYIENAAVQDQRDRKIEGISYLVGGVVAIVLPFVTTTAGSPLRDVGVYALVPAGAFSVVYGGYTVFTDSPWTNLKNKVEKLSGPKEDSAQWRLRREGHSRQALLERADSTRFWRYLWGGVEGGAGALIIGSNRSTPSIAAATLLFGMSAYHLLHKKADERIVDQLDRTTIGFVPERGWFLAHQIRF